MIENINEEIIEYSTESTKIESPGSPVMNGEFKIIGLESKNGASPNKWRAISMNQILEAYKNKILEKYGGRTENKIWLQRINQILQNELPAELIGCGGVGKVFKVIE